MHEINLTIHCIQHNRPEMLPFQLKINVFFFISSRYFTFFLFVLSLKSNVYLTFIVHLKSDQSHFKSSQLMWRVDTRGYRTDLEENKYISKF